MGEIRENQQLQQNELPAQIRSGVAYGTGGAPLVYVLMNKYIFIPPVTVGDSPTTGSNFTGKVVALNAATGVVVWVRNVDHSGTVVDDT